MVRALEVAGGAVTGPLLHLCMFHCWLAAYSTTRYKFEEQLDEIQENELKIAQERGRHLQRMFCARICSQLRLRSAFLATPTAVWGFLILLGMLTVVSV